MRENRDRFLGLIKAVEGGFANHPEDAGGPTNMGVTQQTLSRWRGKPVTIDDVKALTWDEAAKLYLQGYWNKVRGDDLPSGLDIAIAEASVNSNMTGQVKILQNILGVEQDGFVGEQTVAAARKADTADTIRRFYQARLGYLQSLPDWQTFGRGWGRRCEDMQAECVNLVQANVLEARAPKAAAGAAAYSALGILIASLPTLWPELAPHFAGAQTAIATRDWAGLSQSVALAAAVIVPAAIRFYVRYLAHQRAEPA